MFGCDNFVRLSVRRPTGSIGSIWRRYLERGLGELSGTERGHKTSGVPRAAGMSASGRSRDAPARARKRRLGFYYGVRERIDPTTARSTLTATHSLTRHQPTARYFALVSFRLLLIADRGTGELASERPREIGWRPA